MTTDRPYRAAMPVPQALAELRREAGAQFDAAVVAALARVVEREQPARLLAIAS
jgi:HD-GYP domain-containing protein (c-di-GMP phosphodiesterase class II)